VPERALDDAIAGLSTVDSATGSDLRAFVVGTDTADQVVIASVMLGDSLTGVVLDSIKAKTAAVHELTPRAYAPAAELSRGEVMYVESTVGSLGDLETELNAADADVFDPSAAYAKRLKFLVIRVSVAGNAINFYRALQPASWLSRSKKIAIRWQDGYFDKLDTENVLLFDGQFDALSTSGFALFTSKYTFERIFDYEEKMETQSKMTFAAISSGLRINGLAEMEKASTSNPGMMAKLASIQRNMDLYPDYAKAMTMAKLVPFVESHPETGVEIEGTGTSAEFVFHNDPPRRFKLLRLLDDDFLQSELTSNTYEANSKSDPLT
jgi:hypothetical protein